MTVPGADPARLRIEQDLGAGDFEAGVGAGHWRLVRLDWPRLTVAVTCGDGNELGLRIAVDGYPRPRPGRAAMGPARRPGPALQPGGRRAGPPRRCSAGTGPRPTPTPPTWPATGPRSPRTPTGQDEHPDRAWHPGRTIAFYLSEIHRGLRGATLPATGSRPVTATRHGLTMDERLFTTLISELARRGNGERESGAFLLARAGHPRTSGRGSRSSRSPTTTTWTRGCLTGGITFSADGYTALAALCRRDGLRVVGDIHTHPGSKVMQSAIDAAHPMTALPGHIALIAPRYARGITGPGRPGRPRPPGRRAVAIVLRPRRRPDRDA